MVAVNNHFLPVMFIFGFIITCNIYYIFNQDNYVAVNMNWILGKLGNIEFFNI